MHIFLSLLLCHLLFVAHEYFFTLYALTCVGYTT
jgi:hypothetical protein